MKTIKVCSLAAVGALGLYLVLGGPRAAAGSSASEVSPKPAPAWAMTDLSGKPIQSTNLLGKVVILDFWATWCAPCREEIPAFIALQKRYGRQGLVVIGASEDDEGAAAVRKVVKELRINYPVGIADETMTSRFGADLLPTTVVIDRQGRVVQEHLGITDKSEFEAEIKPLLQAGAH